MTQSGPWQIHNLHMNVNENIPWKRLSVEAAAIVVSILLAFAIDAWWDNRQERVHEQDALLGLRAEYQNHLDEISRTKARHLVYLRAIEELVRACGKGSWQSDEFSIDNAIFALLVPETNDLGAGVRDTLISSGKIDILSDRQLRYELSEWDSVVDELLDDQQHNKAIVFDIVLPYLARAGVPFSGAFGTAGGSQGTFKGVVHSKYWSLPKRFLSGDSGTLTRLCSDPEFISIVEARYGFMVHAAGEFDRVISAIDRILARIESSMTK